MIVYETPLFFVKTFIILGIQPIVAFCLLTIFYESGGIVGMVAMLDESLIMIEVPPQWFWSQPKDNTQESISSFNYNQAKGSSYSFCHWPSRGFFWCGGGV